MPPGVFNRLFSFFLNFIGLAEHEGLGRIHISHQANGFSNRFTGMN